MLDSGVVIFVFYLEKEETLFDSVLMSIHQIKLTDKEYNQYVKKAGKIDRR